MIRMNPITARVTKKANEAARHSRTFQPPKSNAVAVMPPAIAATIATMSSLQCRPRRP